MNKKMKKLFIAIGICAISLTSAFFVQKIYATSGDPYCEWFEFYVCSPEELGNCYIWNAEYEIPCFVTDRIYIDDNDSENEQGDVNR